MNFKKVTLSKKLEIIERLKEVLDRTGEDRCSYHDGWNDEAVARGLDVNASHVIGVRRELFGRIRDARTRKPEAPPAMSSPLDAPEIRLLSLEKRLDRMEAFMDEVRKDLDL